MHQPINLNLRWIKILRKHEDVTIMYILHGIQRLYFPDLPGDQNSLLKIRLGSMASPHLLAFYNLELVQTTNIHMT